MGPVSRTQAEEWIKFAEEPRESTTFLTKDLFSKLMGVGTTPPPPAELDRLGPHPMTRYSTNVYPEARQVVPPTVPTRWGGTSKFYFDADAQDRRADQAPLGGYSLNSAELIPRVPHPSFVESAFRTGWWQVSQQGAPTKVGEYQDLRSSAFWDVDQMRSNGVRTLDMTLTGFDNESSHADVYFFSPGYTLNFRYERFLHRLDHDPLDNMPDQDNGDGIVKEDLNVGEDYAIRVQDVRTDVRGKLTKDIKYRINLWLRRRKGERQAIGTQHGAPGDTDCLVCHVQNQRQEIDWLSVRLEPVIEARLGPITLQYSRPMRSFTENDATVTRSYGGFHAYPDYTGDFPYAVVPDTLSQMDRLRLGIDLPAGNRVYSQVHHGDTRNQQRDTRRRYYGFDVRLTNIYFEKLTLNGFTRFNRQLNQLPPFLVPPEDAATSVPTAIVPPYGLRHPIDYLRSSAGGDARWQPFRHSGYAGGLALNAGAEYGWIKRSYAEYQVQEPAATIDQDNTGQVSYFAGTTMRWHPRFDTYLRYKRRSIARPLFGVDQYSGETNTNRPEQEDVVRFGGTFMAATNLIANASIGVENRRHHSDIADFEEDNYPMTFTLWYAPNQAWSISGGYGYYTNWIDQDIYFPSDDPASAPLDRREWNYGGRGQVLSLGASYAWRESITLSGGLQHVWAFDAFDPLTPWPDLPAYSDVIVNTKRYTGGLDWYANDRVSAYMRYVYEDYDDASLAYVSGSVHMFLGGFTAYY